MTIKTLKLKVKPEAYPWLNAAAREVNTVWNFANESSISAATRTDKLRKWMTGIDLCALTAGSTDYFDKISADTIQAICMHYVQKRRAARRLRLRWRASGGSRRALGWVPFKGTTIRRKGNALRFAGKTFRVFEIDRLDGAEWRSGCFAQDALGDWWLSLPVEVDESNHVAPREAVGIDLGLTTIATTSDGDTLEAGRWTLAVADRLALAQRRGHKRQAKRIHRKAARQRQDALHKFSRKVVNEYQHIVIGDVSSTRLAKTRMAKSVKDSGWGMLKAQLQYKGQQAGRSVRIVNENYTSITCSACGSLSGPRGVNGLTVRRWDCCDCGESHDRDVNAARNILRCAELSASVCGNELRQARHDQRPSDDALPSIDAFLAQTAERK